VLKISLVLATTFLFAAMLIAYPYSPTPANHRTYTMIPVPGYMHPRQKTAIAAALPNASKSQGGIRLAVTRRRDLAQFTFRKSG
jgi:hypothetical protein